MLWSVSANNTSVLSAVEKWFILYVQKGIIISIAIGTKRIVKFIMSSFAEYKFSGFNTSAEDTKMPSENRMYW